MLCPFAKNECIEDACALWERLGEECSVLLIAKSINDMDRNGVHVKIENQVLYCDCEVKEND